MAGTIVSDTIQNGAGASTSTTDVVYGSARAWLAFTYISGTLSTLASYNVSSFTRSASGAYSVSFTTALIDANYAVVGGAGAISTGGATTNVHPHSTTSGTYSAPTSSTFVINIVTEAGSANVDPYTAAFAVHR